MTAFPLLNQQRSGNCTAILLSFFIKTIKLWLIIGMDDCPKIHTNSRVDKKNRMSHIYGKLITAAADKEKLSVLQVSARCECMWFFFILLNVTKYIPIDCFFATAQSIVLVLGLSPPLNTISQSYYEAVSVLFTPHD